MSRFFTLFIIMTMTVAAGCGGQNRTVRNAPVEPVFYGFRIVAEHPHLTSSYTQGLQYIDGEMWEGTGQYGESKLQRIDLESGSAEVIARLPDNEFGEGITVLGDRIYQLTWMNNTVHIYDRASGRLLKNIRYSGEGWGLTSDGEQLYMSNGSSRIFRIEPATFARKSAFTVTLRGEPLEFINELEWIDGRLWANIYTLDQIAVINPANGVVEGIIDLRGLLPESERTNRTDVLNGIARDSETGRIFVTGKYWSRIYEIEIFEK
ncbi:MAG: glutaminyl-peptide cyclotransferase [Alistipes sp.]|nr:glutaminyl-peptide cyclotransferase [Alistipes sp.]